MTDSRDVKILVVDDNPGTLYATSRVLRAGGFTVIEAINGKDALAAAPAADLIVLDINLPDMDGFEVCREIRANRATARTPVIHLSATFVKELDKVRGLNQGADGYLTHPVEPPVLIATVNAFLRARQAEDAMRESEARFRAIFDQVPHGIALISQDFVYLEINPAMCVILGHPREHIVGKHNSAFMPLGREHEVVALARHLETDGAWRGNTELLRADGSHVQLEWRISTFSIPGVRLAIVSDITERRTIEAERERLLASERAARAEAERANRLKDDFLATISHELRTPLNAIVTWADLLHRDASDPADLAEGLEAIQRNARAQSQLIADLLDVSRITSGKLRLELQPVDAAAIVDAALASVLPAAKARGISLVKRLAPGAPILADPNRLQQIVWNLVTNAVKFTPPGGAVTITISYLHDSMILAVADTGKGIPADFLPRLFERFSQADASSRRLHGGLGIGLAIVKNLVEMHGGAIHAASAGNGSGSTFTMTLPLVARQDLPAPDSPPPDLAPDAPAPVPADLGLPGVRVLILEDDPDARRVLSRLLADFDATVFDVDSADKALAALPTFDPHVVVSDIGMPGRDGYDFVRSLRARRDPFATLPAIALTAFVGPENKARALAEGFHAHLAKPVNPVALVMEIKKLLTPTHAHATTLP